MKATFSKDKQTVVINGEIYVFARATYNETRQAWSFVFKKLALDKVVDFNLFEGDESNE